MKLLEHETTIWPLDSHGMRCTVSPSGWLRAAADVCSLRDMNRESLLRLNAELTGDAAICLNSDGAPMVRIDTAPPVNELRDDRRAGAARLSLDAAIRVVTDPCALVGGSAEPGGEAPDIERLATAAGWMVHPRSGRRLSIDLETLHYPSSCDAYWRNGRIRLTSTLSDWNRMPDHSKECAAYLLLRATESIRVVRAAITADDLAVLIADVAPANDTDDLNHALCALSVGMQQMQLEMSALTNPAIANRCMAVVMHRDS